MKKFKLTITPDQLAELVPGSRVLEIPDEWFESLEPSRNVFEQLYAWLRKQGFPDGGLHSRARVGDRFQRRLIRAEKKRLSKKFKGEKLKKALFWSDFGSGPMESFAERTLLGSAVCVLPPERTKAEEDAEHRLFEEQFAAHAKHGKRFRQRMSGSSFYYWIIGAREYDDRIGDIARDTFADNDFPRDPANFQEIKRYLQSSPCSYEAMECAEDAWIEYLERYPERVQPKTWCDHCEQEIAPTEGSVTVDSGRLLLVHGRCEPDDVDDRLPVSKLFSHGLQAFREFIDPYEVWDVEALEKRLRLYGFHDNQIKSFIYFIQIGVSGPIKIGITGSVEKRLAALQTSHPEPLRVLATLEGGRSFEQELHRRFAVYRKHGEWFEPHPDIIAFLSPITLRAQSL